MILHRLFVRSIKLINLCYKNHNLKSAKVVQKRFFKISENEFKKLDNYNCIEDIVENKKEFFKAEKKYEDFVLLHDNKPIWFNHFINNEFSEY